MQAGKAEEGRRGAVLLHCTAVPSPFQTERQAGLPASMKHNVTGGRPRPSPSPHCTGRGRALTETVAGSCVLWEPWAGGNTTDMAGRQLLAGRQARSQAVGHRPRSGGLEGWGVHCLPGGRGQLYMLSVGKGATRVLPTRAYKAAWQANKEEPTRGKKGNCHVGNWEGFCFVQPKGRDTMYGPGRLPGSGRQAGQCHAMP